MKTISIKWSTEDVLEDHPWLSEDEADEADEVLDSLDKNHDANIGINWEVINVYVSIMYPEKADDE